MVKNSQPHVNKSPIILLKNRFCNLYLVLNNKSVKQYNLLLLQTKWTEKCPKSTWT